jgi:dUTP pyrophosphatase
MTVMRYIVLPHGEGLPAPSYRSEQAAGLDLSAALADGDPLALSPGDRALIPTGIAIELPEGFEAQVRPRSGLAHKYGVTVLNSPGTIDADYRGEIKVLLINLSNESVTIRRGDRIAQLVIAPILVVTLKRVISLATTGRGSGGFGSTGAS